MLRDGRDPLTLCSLGASDNHVEPRLSAAELAIAKAINSGGSGRGMSYYSAASRCGRRSRLQDERHQSVVEQGNEGLPQTKHALVIGSIYHLLHEQLRRPRPDLELDFTEAVTNPNVVEALRMFRGFKNIWGAGYWGRTVEVEHRLHTTIGGEVVSGTMDMVAELDEEAAARAQRRLPGITPGRYVIDWKTADSDSDGVALAEGLQAMWYPTLWNRMYPATPVEGIIFDIAMKRGRRKDRAMYATDFQAVLVRTPPDNEGEVIDALRGMVKQGALNVLHDIPNRAECVDWRGQVCPFYKSACNGVLGEDK